MGCLREDTDPPHGVRLLRAMVEETPRGREALAAACGDPGIAKAILRGRIVPRRRQIERLVHSMQAIRRFQTITKEDSRRG